MQHFRVPYIDLPAEFLHHGERLQRRFQDICSRGQYILRDEVRELEQRAAAYLGVRHAIGVGNGSDALLLALKALGLGPGDEVITVAHTFVATLAAITFCGATPVLVDIGPDHNLDPNRLAEAITPATRAVLPVHLNGRCCDMQAIQTLCRAHGLDIVEDAAQAFGSRYRSRHAGSFGRIGCFSLHPMKVLHALGDAGLVVTDDDELAARIRLLRNHGHQSKEEILCYGFNSRLDNLQAGFLLEFFEHLDEWLRQRRVIAAQYHHNLSDIPGITLPPPPDVGDYFDIYSSYVIRSGNRNALRNYLLNECGIEVFSHWDPPLHRQKALGLSAWHLPHTDRLAGEVLSLPMYPGLQQEQISWVTDRIRAFHG
ncbi:MAG: hypothetical protein BWK76_14535 [Desulfobulbaceae bacterium A2]|nr:MAG: hypothetical protein BWK76_14535 [Desulfobulbaceae bacterium A2]